jgi:hypothetical protein
LYVGEVSWTKAIDLQRHRGRRICARCVNYSVKWLMSDVESVHLLIVVNRDILTVRNFIGSLQESRERQNIMLPRLIWGNSALRESRRPENAAF